MKIDKFYLVWMSAAVVALLGFGLAIQHINARRSQKIAELARSLRRPPVVAPQEPTVKMCPVCGKHPANHTNECECPCCSELHRID